MTTPTVTLPFGTSMIPVELGPGMDVVKQTPTVSIPAVADMKQTVPAALDQPLDRPPLQEQVRPGHRVTVAFDDPTVFCYAPVWETALPAIVAHLEAGGVRAEDITLLCANGLHRQFTFEELARTIGRPLAERFGDRLRCHDAEDPDGLVHLGHTRRGHDVEVSRLAAKCDLCVYLNASCGGRSTEGGSRCAPACPPTAPCAGRTLPTSCPSPMNQPRVKPRVPVASSFSPSLHRW